MLEIVTIGEEGPELDHIRDLLKEYEKELGEDLCFQSFEEELAHPLEKYGEPAGTLILARWNGEVAGCIALKPLAGEGLCEMKRLYVRPAYRSFRIGLELVKELLHRATEKGYAAMRLDTFDRLRAAIHLYERFGFVYIEPYYTNPLPGVVYMEKMLG